MKDICESHLGCTIPPTPGLKSPRP
jgi:hypothetical protein